MAIWTVKEGIISLFSTTGKEQWAARGQYKNTERLKWWKRTWTFEGVGMFIIFIGMTISLVYVDIKINQTVFDLLYFNFTSKKLGWGERHRQEPTKPYLWFGSKSVHWKSPCSFIFGRHIRELKLWDTWGFDKPQCLPSSFF